METRLNDDAIKRLYNNANESTKGTLDSIFGEKAFYRDPFFSISKQVKMYICSHVIIGNSPLLELPLSDREIAMRKLQRIVLILNTYWEPDWNNKNERKWIPRFNMNPFSFDRSFPDSEHTCAGHESSFRFKSQELSDFCAREYIDLWRIVQFG